jgi:hypothetical protein
MPWKTFFRQIKIISKLCLSVLTQLVRFENLVARGVLFNGGAARCVCHRRCPPEDAIASLGGL